MLVAPAGVSEPIATSLERVVRDALQAPEVRQKLAAENELVVGSTSTEARARIAEEAKLWNGVVKAADMHAE